jgi:alanine racemase
MLYGLYPQETLHEKIHLKPVLKVRSRVIFLKDVKKGRSISYGRTFFTKKDMRIATVPVGYNDGYFRAFSNRADISVRGIRCPVVGTVTMDQTMVDVSAVNDVSLSSPVTLLGEDGKTNITADELAQLARTISYEVVCSLGNRLPKIYKTGS